MELIKPYFKGLIFIWSLLYFALIIKINFFEDKHFMESLSEDGFFYLPLLNNSNEELDMYNTKTGEYSSSKITKSYLIIPYLTVATISRDKLYDKTTKVKNSTIHWHYIILLSLIYYLCYIWFYRPIYQWISKRISKIKT